MSDEGGADFQVCRIAGFQTRWPQGSHADLEVGDTAGLETCATQNRQFRPHQRGKMRARCRQERRPTGLTCSVRDAPVSKRIGELAAMRVFHLSAAGLYHTFGPVGTGFNFKH